MKLQEDKNRFIKLPRNLKEIPKQAYRGNIDWETHECKYLGEDENWIYITPLSWKGVEFCDSAKCGGVEERWPLAGEGYGPNGRWTQYEESNVLFLMKFNKHSKNNQEDLKFMIEGYPGEAGASIWGRGNRSKKYTPSEIEREYLNTIQKIQEDIRREWLGGYFDNPEPGVYVAKNVEALKHIEDIRANLRVFKVKEGVTFQNVKDAYCLFYRCESLTSVDTSTFVNVENAVGMFDRCTSLTSIDTSMFKRVRYTGGMFSDCTSLTSIDTSAFVSVVDANCMFDGCTSLTSIDTSSFKRVRIAEMMFRGCTSLTSIDASAFRNVRDAHEMFRGCTSLTSIDTSAFKNVENAAEMFQDCSSLTSIDTSGFENAEDITMMFRGCKSLTSIDTSGFVNVVQAIQVCMECPSLKTYIPGPNNMVNDELEKRGAKPVGRLGESLRRKVIEEILED